MRPLGNSHIVIVGLLSCCLAWGQTRRDPRAVALAGAYGALARGIFAVDYNPANLAIDHEYTAYRVWGGLNTSFATNFLSINSYRRFNGQDLEANGGALKKEFLEAIPPVGWRIFSDVHLALPYLNFSRYNHAISADLIVIGDIGLPRGLVRFYFDGNPINERLEMNFQEELIALVQWGYSVGFPMGGYYWGVTAKYLSGLGYFGLDPDSSFGYLTTYFEPGRNYMVGEGRYYFQQALGGRGLALDIGVTTPIINRCRFGLSIINLFGFIHWRRNTLITRLIDEEKLLPMEGKTLVYSWKVNEARFERFFQKNKFEQIFEGKKDFIQDTTGFRTVYPSLVRMSLAREMEEGFTLATDLIVGFDDRLFGFGAWKWAVGFESTKNRRRPLRIGVSFGGNDHEELAFGSGFHWGFIHCDWAIGLKQGLWFTTAKGLDLAVNVYTTSRAR